jgi:4-hydroxy-L-threonine phosphate dehydrogenase PdxA
MRIAVILGDPNGIGREVAIKAAHQVETRRTIQPVPVADRFVIRDRRH